MELIQKLFPGYTLKRELARLRLHALTRAYEGGKINDYHRPIIGAGESANTSMENAGINLRNRSRYFDENHDIVTGIFDTLVNNIIGNADPIRPMIRNPDGTLNTEANLRLKRLWKEFSIKPTICKQYTMLQALKLSCRGWLRDGEYLTRIVRGHSDNIVPLAFELIESDYLPYEKSVSEDGKPTIIQGVEFNNNNEVTGYHLYDHHPDSGGFGIVNIATHRVDADEIIHVKFTRRTHQVRGVPLLHSVMLRLDDLKDYEESERIAARVAAAMTGFVQKPGETMGQVGANNERTFEMSPGMIFDNLMPGETIGTIASNRPNPELITFRSAMLRAVAAGTGTNYSTISRDYNGTYSSQRQELLESKPNYEALRQQFSDYAIFPIWREFIKMAKFSGKIKAAGIDPQTIDDLELRGINIGWIDPKKQADASATSINSGIMTRGQVIREKGGDPESVFAEMIEEKKLFGDIAQDTEKNKGAENEKPEQD